MFQQCWGWPWPVSMVARGHRKSRCQLTRLSCKVIRGCKSKYPSEGDNTSASNQPLSIKSMVCVKINELLSGFTLSLCHLIPETAVISPSSKLDSNPSPCIMSNNQMKWYTMRHVPLHTNGLEYFHIQAENSQQHFYLGANFMWSCHRNLFNKTTQTETYQIRRGIVVFILRTF